MSADMRSYFDHILRYGQREALMLQCPALMWVTYQHVAAAIVSGTAMDDPLVLPADAARDAVGELLRCSTMPSLMEAIMQSRSETDPHASFWLLLQRVLATRVLGESDDAQLLHVVGDRRHFHRDDGAAPSPVSATSLHNAFNVGQRYLRSVVACALAGSTSPLMDQQQQSSSPQQQQQGLCAVMRSLRLVPGGGPSSPTRRSAEAEELTVEGLNFCMMALPQQWWLLVSATVDRVLELVGKHGATKPMLWQMLAVLTALDGTQHSHPFPSKAADAIGYELLARLAEVGLIYPIKSSVDQRKYFVLSPHFRHALEWQAGCALMHMSSSSSSSGGGGGSLKPQHVGEMERPDEMDSILTETNFRLFAYTRREDLLHLLDQFAVREEEAGRWLVCYRITRESFGTALRRGIGAAQVLRFLSDRAHPCMRRSAEEEVVGGGGVASSTIPQSICDQLLMWEREMNRVFFERDAVLLQDLTEEQHAAITAALMSAGESDGLLHEEPGCVVIAGHIYDRLLQPFMSG